MKFPIILSTLALVASCAKAQPGRGTYVRFHPLLSALDVNHDQSIDESELAKAPVALRALDRNQDGRITADEMLAGMGRGGREARDGRGRAEEGPSGQNAVEEAVKTYLSFDKNDNGKLTPDEVPERMQGIFERGDTDKDGVLTGDELRAMARTQQQPAGMGGGREGGQGRGDFRSGRRFDGMRRMDPVFQALDANHDGVIDSDEITNAASSLRALDKNRDGQITEDEVRPNFGFGRGRG